MSEPHFAPMKKTGKAVTVTARGRRSCKQGVMASPRGYVWEAECQDRELTHCPLSEALQKCCFQ